MSLKKELMITLLVCLILITLSLLFWLIVGGTTQELLLFMAIDISMIFVYLIANLVFTRKSKESETMRKRKSQENYDVVKDVEKEEVVEFNGLEEDFERQESKKHDDENIITLEEQDDKELS